jgi:hypothetical protein
MSTTCYASSWQAHPGWKARDFKIGRRVIGLTTSSSCHFEWRDGERERGDGTGEDKSSHLTRVHIYVVKKYMDHVRSYSVCRPGTGRTLAVEHYEKIKVSK